MTRGLFLAVLLVRFGSMASFGAVAASPGAPPQPPSVVATPTGAGITGVASKARVALGGGSYSVPPSVTWLAMVQPGAVASQTVVLPASPADGQVLFVSTAGMIRSMSFSPAVPGWANGSALPANSGLTLGWDAGFNIWMRIE